jgi:hypothetical protein
VQVVKEGHQFLVGGIVLVLLLAQHLLLILHGHTPNENIPLVGLGKVAGVARQQTGDPVGFLEASIPLIHCHGAGLDPLAHIVLKHVLHVRDAGLMGHHAATALG